MSQTPGSTTTTAPGSKPNTLAGQVQQDAGGASGAPLEFGDAVWGVSQSVFENNPTVIMSGDQGSSGTTGAHTYAKTLQLQDALKLFDQADPQTRAKFQMQLLLTGYDTREVKKVRFGSADPESRKAWGHAIEAANANGTPLLDLLNAVPGTQQNIDSLTGITHTNVVQHAAATDVAAGALKGYQSAIGRAPTAAELQAFQAGYSARETAAQPDTGAGGTFNVNDPGNIQNAAEAQARSDAPELAQGNERLAAFREVLKTVGVTP